MSHAVKVVVVGAGFGGLRAAKGLAHSPVSLTVVDKSNHHLFQPLLYQVATAGLSPADIAYPIRSVVRSQSNVEVLLDEVVDVDTQGQMVKTLNHQLPYDYLVLATGSTHSYFGKTAWESFAPGLKTLKDAIYIRQNILLAFERAESTEDLEAKKAFLTFVIVGGGPTGVELAGAISELAFRAIAADFRHIRPSDITIILVEAGSTVLSSFPEALSNRAIQKLMTFGVTVRIGERVEEIEKGRVKLKGEWIKAETILWAAGVKASPVGTWIKAEMDRSGRVKVESDLRVPGLPNVFVIGDAAFVPGPTGHGLPGVAPVAMQQGVYVAKRIDALIEGKADFYPFEYRDKGNLATVGRKFAVAHVGAFKSAGALAWLIWLLVHIYYLIGFRNRLLVLIQWAWAYLTFQRGARLITEGRNRE